MKINVVRELSVNPNSQSLAPLRTYILQGDDILKVTTQGKKVASLPPAPDSRYSTSPDSRFSTALYASSNANLIARYLASSETNNQNKDGILQIFDERASLKTTIRETGGEIKAIALDSAGKYVAAAFDDQISVYRVDLGRKLWGADLNHAVGCEFSDSSAYLIAITGNVTWRRETDTSAEISVWDIPTGQLVYKLPYELRGHFGEEGGVIEKTFSLANRDKYLITAYEGAICGHKLATGKAIFSIPGHKFAAGTKSSLMVIIQDNQFVLFDPEMNSAHTLGELEPPFKKHYAVAMNSTGTYVVFFNSGTTELWETSTRKRTGSWNIGSSWPYHAAFHENDRSIILCDGFEAKDVMEGKWIDRIHLLEMQQAREVLVLEPPDSQQIRCSMSIAQVWNESAQIEGSKWGRSENEVVFWTFQDIVLRDRKSGLPVFSFQDSEIIPKWHGVHDVLVSARNDILMFTTRDHTRLVDLSSGKLISSSQYGPSQSKYIDDNHEIVASVIGDRIQIWNRPQGRVMHNLTGHSGAIHSFDVDEKRRILSCSSDATLMLWDGPTGNELAIITGHEDAISDCGFTSINDVVFSRTARGKVRLSHIRTPAEFISTFSIDYGVLRAAAHPTLPIIALIKECYDDVASVSIELIDLFSGSKIQDLNLGEHIDCDSLQFSDDGKYLLMGGHVVEDPDDWYNYSEKEYKLFVLDIVTNGAAPSNDLASHY